MTTTPALNDDLVREVTAELLAHGEFSHIEANNRPNAELAAKAILKTVERHQSKEIEVLRAALEWQPIETVPFNHVVDVWCTYEDAPASWGNGIPTGEIVTKRHKSEEYGWFGNQSNDGVPSMHGPDLVPVAWREVTPPIPLEMMDRFVAKRTALKGA